MNAEDRFWSVAKRLSKTYNTSIDNIVHCDIKSAKRWEGLIYHAVVYENEYVVITIYGIPAFVLKPKIYKTLHHEEEKI